MLLKVRTKFISNKNQTQIRWKILRLLNIAAVFKLPPQNQLHIPYYFYRYAIRNISSNYWRNMRAIIRQISPINREIYIPDRFMSSNFNPLNIMLASMQESVLCCKSSSAAYLAHDAFSYYSTNPKRIVDCPHFFFYCSWGNALTLISTTIGAITDTHPNFERIYLRNNLKGQLHEISTLGFFQQSTPPGSWFTG
jgi:hypothetical protein